MSLFSYYFFKITAFLPQIFYYRRKRIRLAKRQSIKGTILIANHNSVYDVPFIIFTFFFRRIYFIAGEQLFEKKFLGWWVKSIGGIKCNRQSKDMDWLDVCAKLLKKKKTILIFPQSRLSPDNEAPFNQNFAALALQTNCPILPLYVNGSYGQKKRARIVIGPKISLNQLWNTELNHNQNLDTIAAHFYTLIKGYQRLVDNGQ